MMSMAFKEGLKIPPPALNEIIIAANQDIRQVIHNISMWSASDKAMTYDQCKADAKNAKKDFKLVSTLVALIQETQEIFRDCRVKTVLLVYTML